MKKYRLFSRLFGVAAILLSDVMCAVVAYEFCALQWGARYAAYGAPASIAFLLLIPYGIGIIICAALSWLFHRKYRKSL